MRETRLRVERPLDLRRTFLPLRRGSADPTLVVEGRTLWRATRTAAGPAATAVVLDPADSSLRCWAWGPGSEAALDGLADLVGAADDRDAFDRLVGTAPSRRPPGWDVVAALARRHAGLRIPRTRAVFEAAVPTVLEQKVTGLEARRSFRELVTALGQPAPGPAGRRGMVVPPSPAALAAVPGWRLHRFGIERKRADTLRRVAAAAHRLEEALAMTPAAAARRLRAVAGVGPWSAAEIALVALGDPDAVSVGDYHLPDQVAWSLAGRARGDDALMLQLLEPWRGHRGLVLRLLTAGGPSAPRFGPRLAPRSIRTW